MLFNVVAVATCRRGSSRIILKTWFMMVPEKPRTAIMITFTTSSFCAGQFFFMDRTILTPFLLC